MVSKPVVIPCVDKNGLPIKDSDGVQLSLTLFKAVPVAVDKVTTTRLFDLKADIVIANWKAVDREQDKAEWEAEQKSLHSLGERSYPVSGRFNAISRDIFASNQPLYYLEGQSISGLTLKPFVKVRLSSSYMRLYVDLGEALRQVSKSKRRKAIRYGKPLPQEVNGIIRGKVLEAVRDYLAH